MRSLLSMSAALVVALSLTACGTMTNEAAVSAEGFPTRTADGLLVGPNGMTVYTYAKDGKNSGMSECYDACATKGRTAHSAAQFAPGDTLLFGPESRGLPAEIIESLPFEQRLRIPMLPQSRSMNLANAVAVFVYESWRQFGYEGSL